MDIKKGSKLPQSSPSTVAAPTAISNNPQATAAADLSTTTSTCPKTLIDVGAKSIEAAKLRMAEKRREKDELQEKARSAEAKKKVDAKIQEEAERKRKIKDRKARLAETEARKKNQTAKVAAAACSKQDTKDKNPVKQDAKDKNSVKQDTKEKKSVKQDTKEKNSVKQTTKEKKSVKQDTKEKNLVKKDTKDKTSAKQDTKDKNSQPSGSFQKGKLSDGGSISKDKLNPAVKELVERIESLANSKKRRQSQEEEERRLESPKCPANVVDNVDKMRKKLIDDEKNKLAKINRSISSGSCEEPTPLPAPPLLGQETAATAAAVSGTSHKRRSHEMEEGGAEQPGKADEDGAGSERKRSRKGEIRRRAEERRAKHDSQTSKGPMDAGAGEIICRGTY